MVLTCNGRNFTITIPTRTATKDPGIFSVIFGITMRIARQTRPTINA